MIDPKIQKPAKNLFLSRIAVPFLCLFVVVLLFIFFPAPSRDVPASNSTDPEKTIHTPAQAPSPITEYLRASELTDPSDTAKFSNISDANVISRTDIPRNPYHDLCIPTWLTKVDDLYFLVDCYHDQIIYNDNLIDPLDEWLVMTDDISKGHTLASDGIVYLADDTERHRVLVFEKKGEAFIHTQTFHDIGNRPHYIIYNEPTDTFYAWSSLSGEMYLFRHSSDSSRMYLTEIRRIEALDNIYVRSFTIIGDEIYFVSGNSSILRADLESFEILEAYPVPEDIAGMVQLTKIQDYFYITVSTDITGNQEYATILRTKDLASLADGGYEDIYSQFIGGGTPYYITCLDDAYYLTEHRLPGHSVWRFQVEDNVIQKIETIY